jgi:hypothetical protein
MNLNTDAPSPDALTEVSFVRGGPFYRAQRALKLLRPDHWDLGRRISVLIVITWLPLLILTAVFNFKGLDSLLRDYRIYARLLIAVPALLFGELLMKFDFAPCLPRSA